MDEDTEYLKLPVEDRCIHKLWKARIHGYEEATKTFRTLDEKSPEWNKYLGLIKKFVGDSHAAAQEKGLETALAYIENAHVAYKTTNEVMPVIVSKCLGSAKAKTRDLAIQICLMYIEIEKQEAVLDELIKGMEHKNPKISSTCVYTVTQALKEFGNKVISIKLLVKKVPALLEDRDKNVRDFGKTLAVEMYRWVGSPLRSQFSNLKAIQLQLLESEFDKIKNEKAVPTRYLRSQQAKESKLEDNVCGEADEDDNDDDAALIEDLDPFDALQPVDILSNLPKDFYEKLEEKKWQERKEALDSLEQQLTKAPKLEPADYGDLVRAIKKVILKDSNVILVGIAAKCMAMIAKGLKKKFQPYAANIFPALLEKFKEKKQNVVIPLRDAVDAIYESTTLEAVQEDILTAMENKNPSVRAETVACLARCFTKCTPLILNKKLLKVFTTALIKTLNESDPVVRDHSAEAIGTAWKVVGEKAIAPLLSDVESIKITKIKEASEKAIITAKMPKASKKVENVKPQAAPEKAKAGSVNPKPVLRKQPTSKKANTAIKRSSTYSTAAPKVSKIPVERELTDEEVDEQSENLFAEGVISGLSDANWKVRLSSMEQFKQTLDNLNSNDVKSQLLIRLLCRKPGFKDNNFQVLKLRLESLNTIAEKFQLTSTAVSFCLNDVITLLADNKNGSLSCDVLMAFSEGLELDYVSNQVLDFSFSQQKNPKVQQEALAWLSNAITEFGFVMQTKPLIEHLKKATGASNPQVRSAVISLLGNMYLYIGPQLATFFENEKPAFLQQINAEFEKHGGEKPPPAKRGKTNSDDIKTPEDVVSDDFDDQQCNAAETYSKSQRIDISPQITDSLVQELTNKDWKVRTEAINKLQEIITEAKCITPNLGDAVAGIAQRLTDSNGRLAAATLGLCETIALVMGPGCKAFIRDFYPKMLQGLGDNKNYLRAAAIKCINTWGDTCGHREFFEGEMIASALKSGPPALRVELWSWIAEKLPDLKNVPKDELTACVPYLYSNIEDRNSDVRKNASEAVVGFMIHLGYTNMLRVCEKLKVSSAETVRQALEKARANVPEKPVAAAKVVKPGLKTAQQSSSKTPKLPQKSRGSIAVKPVAVRKKEEEVDTSPLLRVNNLKVQRHIDEQKLKILRWNFTTPREEFVEQLRDHMNVAGVNKTLITNMFHPDFKFHLKALDALHEDAMDNSEALAYNFDLILKWMTLRFFDTNPSVIIRSLEYLQYALRIMIENGYTMPDSEASAFLPYLVLKTGDPKDAIRNTVKEIFDLIGSTYPATKLFTYVIDGVKSKNARQRTGCLEQLSRLIEDYGLSVCQPTTTAALKEIAKQIGDRDNSVRNAALNCVVAVHAIAGDKVRQMIGHISDKDMSLVDERIKRAARTRPSISIPIATVRPTTIITPQKRLPVVTNTSYETDESEEEIDDDEITDQSPATPQRQAMIRNEQLNQTHTITHGMDNSPSSIFSETIGSSIVYSSSSSSKSHRSIDDITSVSRISPSLTNTSTQKKGYFGLDENVIGAIESTSIHIPKPVVVEYDSRYFQEAVMPINPSPRKPLSNNSPNPRPVSSFMKKQDDLHSWITQMGAPNLDDAIISLQEVEMLLVSEEKKKEIEGMEVTAFTQLMTQLNYLIKSDEPEVATCYKSLFNVFVKVCSCPNACQKIPETLLLQIFEHLLMMLVEKRLEKLGQEVMFVKVVNNLVLKILDRSDHTHMICVLLRMLHAAVQSESSASYRELIMKCLWKTVKLLPEWDTELDYSKILIEVHKFLETFPSAWWKKQTNDTPLRTYKTIVHTMVKTRGTHILTVVKLLPSIPEDAELVCYIFKLLKHLKLESKPDEPVLEKPKALPRELHDQLSDILRKIGNKEETHQGMYMLYEFKERNPDVNTDLFLSKSSKYFQDYVNRNLREIETLKRLNDESNSKIKEYTKGTHIENSMAVAASRMNGKGDCLDKMTDEETEADVHDYKKRLMMLQMRAGWTGEPSHKPDVISSAAMEQSLNCIPVVRRTASPQKIYRDAEREDTQLEQLRSKLAMIKQSKP